MFRCLLTVVCCLLSFYLHALEVKDFTFSHLGKTEGLDNQRIFSIRQTETGAIWWSSMTGVGRYNGLRVKNYPLDKGTPYGHMGGRVINLTTDNGQRKSSSAWAGVYAFDNRGTVYTFDALRDEFELLLSVSKKLGHEVGLNDMLVRGDDLFLALHDGVYKMKDTTLTQVMKGAYVNKIVSVEGRLLFCAREGVYDERGRSLLPYNTECAYYDELSSRLWVGGYENGLHLVTFNSKGGIATDEFVRFEDEGPRHYPIRAICPYNDEVMLIGTDGEGVFQTRRDGRGVCHRLFDANESEHGVLHGNGVYSLLVDTWKNIVIGTYSGGIDIARPIGSTTAIYKHIVGNHQSLLNDHVNMVMPLSDDQLLIGTDNGISIMNLHTREWQHCCQGTVVLNASKKPDGSVLVSTYGKGIYEIDHHAQVRHIYTPDNGPLTDAHVYATLYDSDGGLWVGSLNGDLLYKPASQLSTVNSWQAKRAKDTITQLSTIYYPIHDVQALSELASGQIAVGTAFGLKLVTPGSDTFKELNYAPSGVTDINTFVTHLLTSGLELWIATDGGGVYVYHLAKHESRQITTANGLPSNYVRSLLKSRDGRIWIATDKGLSFVSLDDPDTVVNVNYCYGLNAEYSRGAAQNLPDGDLVFGTTTGVLIVHPENVQSIDYTAQLVILGISCAVDQEKLQTAAFHTLLQQGSAHLAYQQRTFDILFESVNMRNHFDIAYRYQVGKGEWSQPIDQQYIRFVDMEPGTHHLTLQCISRTSGAVIDTKTLTIVIDQPWWNTWWMWCIYITLILLAFYGAWRIYELHEKYIRLTIDHLQKPIDEGQLSTVNSQLSTVNSQSATDGTEGKTFVDKATKLILEHLSDSDFNIDQLCREMAMSRTLFYVKLKSYTGKSPQDFIRIIRLERAAVLLRNGKSVTDVAALTGFDNPKYFSTVFKKYFDISPSKYQ